VHQDRRSRCCRLRAGRRRSTALLPECATLLDMNFYDNMPCLAEDQVDHVEKLFRVPVDSEYPRTQWLACLVRDSELPTDDELRQLRSYIEYAVGLTYNERYQRILVGDPSLPDDEQTNQHLARCNGHNTAIFTKRAGAWFVRRDSWQNGFVPWRHQSAYVPLTLERVIDTFVCSACVDDRRVPKDGPNHGYRKGIRPDWWVWKTLHPDVFPASSWEPPNTWSDAEKEYGHRRRAVVQETVNRLVASARRARLAEDISIVLCVSANTEQDLVATFPSEYRRQAPGGQSLLVDGTWVQLGSRRNELPDDILWFRYGADELTCIIAPVELTAAEAEVYVQLRKDGLPPAAALPAAKALVAPVPRPARTAARPGCGEVTERGEVFRPASRNTEGTRSSERIRPAAPVLRPSTVKAPQGLEVKIRIVERLRHDPLADMEAV
jgi:hypothetical protein